MTKIHINKNKVVAPYKATKIQIAQEFFDSMFPDAYVNNGYFASGPHKWQINEGVEDGDEASIALKKALPKEIFENNEVFTLIPEKNAEAYFKNAVMVPFSEDVPESQYENMVATVKAKYPDAVSDENGWGEIDQDLSDKIANFAAKTKLNEANLSINGSKVIVEDYKERNWAEEYFNSKK